MLFKKKNKKLDSKVRFQHKQFTGKLQTARSYKRNALAIPETKWDKLLSRIGLGSKWAQIAAGLAVLGLLYLVYFPNFLTIDKITITGLSESQTRDFEIAIRNEIANNVLYPEKNLVFLRNQVVYNALAKLPSINKVSVIYKSFSNQELVIEAESKYEKFLVATPAKVYDVYNDGLLKTEAGVSRSSWQGVVNSSMLKVELTGEIPAQNNAQVLHKDLVNYLDNLNSKLSQIEGVRIAYYKFKEEDKPEVTVEPVVTDADTEIVEEVEEEQPAVVAQTELSLPVHSAEVHAVIYKGTGQNTYRVIFDETKDVQKSIDNLKLLLSQTPPERYNQLTYIDLRLEERAYLCLQGAACNK